jgi:apolipoprotein D and lipocalin family protein
MNTSALLIIVTAAFALLLAACAGPTKGPPVRTVPSVDLARYTGTWYEIARYPNSFQKGCRDTTAVYILRPDGEITVVNRCLKGADGKVAEARGRAWLAEPPDTTRLKVTFFWPFRGDYWIIDLGKNYEYAVVGTPDREYLWILSRTPVLQDKEFAGIIQRLNEQGFDPEKLLMTGHGIP